MREWRLYCPSLSVAIQLILGWMLDLPTLSSGLVLFSFINTSEDCIYDSVLTFV